MTGPGISDELPTMKSRIEGVFLEQHELDQVRAILSQWIPGRAVWVFGSRANGRRIKRYSDLDLAVEKRLSPKERGSLTEAFDESTLAFKVDLIELEQVDTAFRSRIEPDFVLLQPGDSQIP